MFAISRNAAALPDGMPGEPRLVAGPVTIGFDEPERLDRRRAVIEPEPPPARRRRLSPAGLLGALAVHLLPFAALLDWTTAPAEIPPPIPVSLVIEQPPPPPPAVKPAPQPKPPAPGRLASENMGAPTPPQRQPDAEPQPQPPPRPPEPKRTEVAVLRPPPPEPPLPPSPTLLPEPAPLPEPVVALPPPKPRPPRPPPMPAMHRFEAMPRERPRAPPRIPGPEATRDEYLAYLVTLTRKHLNLLPLNLIGDRRGVTQLSILVLGDGTIARIAVERSSGYPDIDARIEEMVAAVRRFPPLPQWVQGPSVELSLRLRFPEAAELR